MEGESKEKRGNGGQADARASVSAARIVWDEEGIPVAEQWSDRYFSADGGLEESSAVFLRQSGLPERWQDGDSFAVGELGFGSGLNFFLTWELWRQSGAAGSRRASTLHYVACECAPVAPDDMRRICGRWPRLMPLVERLLRRFPVAVAGVHRIPLDDGVLLTLLLGDARELLPRYAAEIDAWYLDGFAPSRNAELWEESLLAAVARLSHRQTTIATYTVAGEVRRRLERFGCSVEKRPGFGRKSEMLRGEFRSRPERSACARPESAAVIGGGLAGTAAALSLARRGCRVELFERGARIAGGASGNSAGIVMPHLAFPHEPMCRWYRSGYVSMLAQWEALLEAGCEMRGARCGVVRMASSDRLERFFDALSKTGGDGEYIQTLDRETLAERAGCSIRTGGFFLPAGGWVAPPDLARANLELAGDLVRTRVSTRCAELVRSGGLWRLLGDGGQLLGEYSIVVVASGSEALELPVFDWLPLERVRGQLVEAPATQGPKLQSVVCYDGYVVPLSEETHLIGATYDHHLEDPNLRECDTAELFERARTWITDGVRYRTEDARGRVSFRMMCRDRLPLVGPAPDIERLGAWRPPYRSDGELHACVLEDLYLSLGHGSRGLISAHLAGEILASRIFNEPPPLESDLIDAVSPMRFTIRRARRGELVDRASLSTLQVKPGA